MPPPRIERGLQVPETCVISFSPRGLEMNAWELTVYHTAWQTVNVVARGRGATGTAPSSCRQL